MCSIPEDLIYNAGSRTPTIFVFKVMKCDGNIEIYSRQITITSHDIEGSYLP